MKKYLYLFLSLVFLQTAFGAIGSNLDSVTVGSYLYPKADELPLGASDKKWASWLSSINGLDIEDISLPAGGSDIDYLTGDRTWVNLTTSAVTEGTRLYYTDERVRAAVSGTAPITFDSGTGAIGCTAASTSVAGCLSPTDWNTFNGKQSALSTSGAVSNQFVVGFTAPNTFERAQPAFTNLSGVATVAQKTIATQVLTTCTTARTVDWSTGDDFSLLLTSGNACTLSFSNALSGQVISIELTNGSGDGDATVVWPSTRWAGGVAPVMSTGASALDVCTIKYNGSAYSGSCIQDMSTP